MDEHTDVVHYEGFGFCRLPCAECDRLDREEYEEGMPPGSVLARGVIMALDALSAEQRATLAAMEEQFDERR
jgi:hypothetical protein